MNSMLFLVDIVFGLYLMVVLLRIWLQLARADFYNPFSQFIVKATHPVVGPLRRIIPSIGRLDTATLLLAYIVSVVGILLKSAIVGQMYTNPVGLLIASTVDIIQEAFQLVIWVLIIRAILSWFSQGHNPMEMVLHQLTEPFLAPIRRIIPPMGGLDLSVMVVIIGLIFLQKLAGDILGYI
ncbi:YggT family protein [Aestuariibacter sp. AA17]|uniref:YggT family protein n=1 Tax=Fluctibacter corallii TaxID=2984329 RepID=A0ABT3A481_9ALTE|nr:YggT family protein [Aestuariibacter sp. AA17]MCV2883500.1 YggT family protein [Aestuariibacter sp. AA17]